jgi:hypothetical protein
MEKFIMKKQIIAAAVAASVSAVALADISITGSAKYEYLYTDTSANDSKNESNTEMKLAINGKNGDTGVFIGVEIDGSDSTDNGAERLDIEDMYITTKVGDINVKAGNWLSGTSSLVGEILDSSRSNGKVDLSTTIGGVKVYAGNSGTNGDGFGRLDENMYAGAVFNIAGATFEAKHKSDTEDHYGLKGELNGLKYRIEQLSKDAANSDATFAEISTKVGGMGVSYAMINSDPGVVTEDDSAIFAVEMASTTVNGGTDDAQNQVTLTTAVDGNNLTFKVGRIDNAFGAAQDLDYYQLVASRALASGATATVTYTDQDISTTATKETLEVELSVSF